MSVGGVGLKGSRRWIRAAALSGIDKAYTLGDIDGCKVFASTLVQHPIVTTPNLPWVTPTVMAQEGQSRILLIGITAWRVHGGFGTDFDYAQTWLIPDGTLLVCMNHDLPPTHYRSIISHFWPHFMHQIDTHLCMPSGRSMSQ